MRGTSDAARFLSLLLQDRVARRTSVVLICITVAILAVFVISGIWDEQSRIAHALFRNLNPAWDEGVAESFNHGLSFMAAIFVLMAYIQVRARVFLFLTALYGFIWLDDSAQYHERAGEKLGQALGIPVDYGLGAQQYGELLAWAIAGLLLLVVFAWFWHGRRPGDTGIVLPFFLCFMLLVIFGVFADMLHMVLPLRFDTLMQAVEDGGEMLAIAASTSLALGISRNVEAYYDGVALAGSAETARAQAAG